MLVFSGIQTQVTTPPFVQTTGVTAYTLEGVVAQVDSTTQISVYNLQACASGTSVSVQVKLLTPNATSMSPGVAVTTYYQRLKTNRVNYAPSTPLGGAPVTLQTRPLMSSFALSSGITFYR